MPEDQVLAEGRLTVQQLWAVYPDEGGPRHELIDGVHFVTPTPVTRHQQLVSRLTFEIESYLRAHPGSGEVFGVPLDVVISDRDVVEPDLQLITADQSEILTTKNVQGAPALVVEVLSPSTRRRDLGIKRDLFDRAGVREYWIVDGGQNAIDVYRRSADGLLLSARLRADAGEALTTPLLPTFTFALNQLFR